MDPDEMSRLALLDLGRQLDELERLRMEDGEDDFAFRRGEWLRQIIREELARHEEESRRKADEWLKTLPPVDPEECICMVDISCPKHGHLVMRGIKGVGYEVGGSG